MRKVKCPLCDKYVKHRPALRTHLIFSHTDGPSQADEIIARNPIEKIYDDSGSTQENNNLRELIERLRQARHSITRE